MMQSLKNNQIINTYHNHQKNHKNYLSNASMKNIFPHFGFSYFVILMFRSSRILPSTYTYQWTVCWNGFHVDISGNAGKQTLRFYVDISKYQQHKYYQTYRKKSASKDSTLETETVDRFSPLLFQRLLLPPLGLSWWPCLKLDAQTKGRALPLQPPQPVATPPPPPCRHRALTRQSRCSLPTASQPATAV